MQNAIISLYSSYQVPNTKQTRTEMRRLSSVFFVQSAEEIDLCMYFQDAFIFPQASFVKVAKELNLKKTQSNWDFRFQIRTFLVNYTIIYIFILLFFIYTYLRFLDSLQLQRKFVKDMVGCQFHSMQKSLAKKIHPRQTNTDIFIDADCI